MKQEYYTVVVLRHREQPRIFAFDIYEKCGSPGFVPPWTDTSDGAAMPPADARVVVVRLGAQCLSGEKQADEGTARAEER